MSEKLPLLTWRSRIDQDERRCPWPGPRPLGPGDPEELLCGRERDIEKFLNIVSESSLVTLHGVTGVGKSSLLSLGLMPKLRRNGYVVATCREWGGSSTGSATAAQFLTDRVFADLCAQGIERIGGEPLRPELQLFQNLDAAFGATAVLVLDQFEELIRDDPHFTEQMYDAINWLHHKTKLKIVISLRSEYLHELRPLEVRARSFQLGTFALGEIEDHYALEVVTSPDSKAGRDNSGDSGSDEPAGHHSDQDRTASIDRKAAQHIADAWVKARQVARKQNSTIGLLHLQALLYSLFFSDNDGYIELDEVHSYFAAQQSETGTSLEVFSLALADTVDTKLGRCKEFASNCGFDEYTIEATAFRIRQMARHLSFDGYKLVRGAYDLFQLTLGHSLETLRAGIIRASIREDETSAGGVATRDEIQAAQLRRERAALDALLVAVTTHSESGTEVWPPEVVNWPHPGPHLMDARRKLAAIADDADESSPLTPWSKLVNTSHDPAEVSSGTMMGCSPVDVLFEEMRRFAFALDWLQQTDLIRLSASRGVLRVALIHDVFGTALESWTGGTVITECPDLYGVTATIGAEYDWHQRSATGDATDPESTSRRVYLAEFDGMNTADGTTKVILNQRWKAAWIRADFRHLVFINCDFRASSFVESSFEGVAFINCLMDGAMISDCAVVGASMQDYGDWVDQPEPYELVGNAHLAKLLGQYQGESTQDDLALVSRTPGFSAAAMAHIDGRRTAIRPTAGLVFQGGRTSNMVIRGCQFENLADQKATLTLRETAGSNLTIGEQLEAGRYEILGCVLRHVEIDSSPVSEETVGELDVYVEYSTLAQMWVGSDLTGSMRIVNSRVIQLWNGSAPNFDVVLTGDASGDDGNRYHGLVGVRFDPALTADRFTPEVDGERSFTLEEVDADKAIRLAAIGMAYRRDPTLPEVDRHGLLDEGLQQ